MSGKMDGPATKADIRRADQRGRGAVKRLDRKLDVSVERLDQKIEAMGKRLSLEILRTNDRIDRSEERLTSEMRQLNSEVTGKLDTFIDRMETLWRESATLPKEIDVQAATLRNHERRLQALETGARPTP